LKIFKKHITKNKFSRPGYTMKRVKGVVVHWVDNPNTSADANIDFFDLRSDGNSGYGGAHFFVDFDGTVKECIPVTEYTYHVGANQYSKKALEKLGTYPNNCTIGIECVHLNDSGAMTTETYDSLLELCADLLKEYELTVDDLYLHYDITGKRCHRWFVNNPDKWETFKKEVTCKMEGT
jgi:N-acetylmuramoyl-L-alanine amidase